MAAMGSPWIATCSSLALVLPFPIKSQDNVVNGHSNEVMLHTDAYPLEYMDACQMRHPQIRIKIPTVFTELSFVYTPPY
jgi:hypothetical protein